MTHATLTQSEEISRPNAAIRVFRYRLSDTVRRALSTGATSLREVRMYEVKAKKEKKRNRKKLIKKN